MSTAASLVSWLGGQLCCFPWSSAWLLRHLGPRAARTLCFGDSIQVHPGPCAGLVRVPTVGMWGLAGSHPVVAPSQERRQARELPPSPGEEAAGWRGPAAVPVGAVVCRTALALVCLQDSACRWLVLRC